MKKILTIYITLLLIAVIFAVPVSAQNFLPENEILKETDNYTIRYFPDSDSYQIVILASPFDQHFAVAEKNFIQLLGDEVNTICQKEVNINTPFGTNPDESTVNHTLSFCLPSVRFGGDEPDIPDQGLLNSDLDDNGLVNTLDLAILLDAYHTEKADVNNDGKTNAIDYSIVISWLGTETNALFAEPNTAFSNPFE